MNAIWTDAYRAARAAVSPDRDRLAVEVEQLREEVDALTTAVAEVEEARDSAINERDLARDGQRAIENELREARETVNARDVSLQEVREVREQMNGLLSRLTDLIALLPEAPKN